MFTPLSLRLCCMAAMAPALTDAAGQPRIQLTGSPPPHAAETTSTSRVVNGAPHHKLTNGFGIASEKGIGKPPHLTLTTNHQKGTRGLLKPIQGNGALQSLYTNDSNSSKIHRSLKDLGLLPLPNFLKNITFTTQSAPNVNHVDHQYNKAGNRKMNHTSNDNGPNGTGKRFTKQTIFDGRSVNGHTTNHAQYSKKFQYNRTTAVAAKPRRASAESDQINVKQKMCRSTELKPQSVCPKMANQLTSAAQFDSRLRTSEHLYPRSNVDVQQDTNRLIFESEPKPVDTLKETERKQVLLEKRSQFLLRRLRRLQGKHLETHVKSQLKSFVNYQHKNLQSVATKAIGPIGSESENVLFQNYDIKNLSTAALVSLVRKLQSPQSKVPLEHLSKKKPKIETRGVLVMDPSTSSESARKSAHLQTNLSHWVTNVDSDETESSSGGESCDDHEYPAQGQHGLLPLYKRAEWKWVVDRAAIVSRWTWLQAQVSDLEYRIRQQSDIHKTIRASKGVVTLGEPLQPTILGRISAAGDAGMLTYKGQEVSPCNISTLLNNVNRQATKLTQSLGGCFSPITNSTPRSLNGYVDGSHTNVTSTPHLSVSRKTPINHHGAAGDFHSAIIDSPDLSQMLDVTCVAARCRPLQSSRKRKLLRTAGLHQVSHKAARLSSVKCQCYPSVMSCPMCGGRYNNFQRLDAEGMPITEKVSLLDPAYHPVLSFPQEIPLPVHFEALLKSGEWQSAKPPPKLSLKAIAAEKRRQKLLAATLKDQNRKNRKKLAKSAAAVLLNSAKLRSKYEGKSPHGTPTKKKVTAETRLRRKELKRRRAAQLAITALRATNPSMCSSELDRESVSTRSTTPTPSPQSRDVNGLSGSCSSSMLKDLKAEAASRKKKFENAYDINNIVIPYSMAASTRVEKLQYKEIQTPKWRDMTVEVNVEPGMDIEMPDADETEDISDEAVEKRHNDPEASERKRFRSFVMYPPVRRGRMSRESESHSSLDALSPDLCATDAYFQSVVANETQSLHSLQVTRDEGRRRSGSTSSKRTSFDDLGRDFIMESLELHRGPVDPWPTRTFPLDEDHYSEMRLEQAESVPSRQVYRTRVTAVKLETEMEFEGVAMCGRPRSPLEPASPAPSSSSGSLMDDIDDPEWNASRPRKMHRSKR